MGMTYKFCLQKKELYIIAYTYRVIPSLPLIKICPWRRGKYDCGKSFDISYI